MQINLKLSQKGIVLVAVPLVFQLVLLALLAMLLKQTEFEVERQLRSREVTSTIDLLSKEFDDAAAAMANFSVAGSQLFKERYSKVPGEVRDLERRLDFLAGTDAHQRNIFNRLKQIADNGLAMLVRADSAGNEKTDVDEETARKLYKSLSEIASSLREEAREFIKDERRIQLESPETQAHFKADIENLLIAGTALNIALALFLALFFSRGITRRLSVLTDNSYRLASRQTLHPALEGADEIAALDRVFHEMAKELGEATRKERAILDNATEVILALDETLRIAEISPASAHKWGYTPEELLGQRLLSLIAEPDRERMTISFQNAITGNTGIVLETKLVKKDGGEANIEWTGVWSREDRRLICVCHDTTERKRLEQLKSEFVAMVTHDLRTPLTSLRMLLSALQEGLYGEISERGKIRIQNMNNDTGRMVNLISELLDMEKLEAGKLNLDLKLCSVREIIDQAAEAVANLCSSNSITLRTDCADLQLKADSNRLVQVLINLLGNAIKFSPKGESIILALKREEDWLRFSVSDHGPGIPDSHKTKIFDRFEQIEIADIKLKGGTGLGLSICKAIVDAHGGTIGVDSTDGKGSTFWFRIPAIDEK